MKFDAESVLYIKATLGIGILRLQLLAHSMLGRTEVSRKSEFTEMELSDDEDTSTGSRISSRYQERGKRAVVATRSRDCRVTGVGVLMVIVTGPHSNLCSLFPCGFGAMSGWSLEMANTCPSGPSIALTQ
jgi:hypothetical protein